MKKQLTFAHFLFLIPIIAVGVIGFAIATVLKVTAQIVTSIDWTLMGEAIADVLVEPFRPLPYLFHNVKFYWQQLWVSEEVLDLDYFQSNDR